MLGRLRSLAFSSALAREPAGQTRSRDLSVMDEIDRSAHHNKSCDHAAQGDDVQLSHETASGHEMAPKNKILVLVTLYIVEDRRRVHGVVMAFVQSLVERLISARLEELKKNGRFRHA